MGSATACVVGMTMGARKRAARQLADSGEEELPPDGGSDYASARLLYRVGQRLRPCRGCDACDHTPTCTCAPGTPNPQHERGCPVLRREESPCDGSGLLPAKKSRSRRRLDASHVLAVLDRAEMERADAERLVATCGNDLVLARAIAWIAECDGRIADTVRRLASGWTIPERRDGFSDEDLLATYLDHTPPSRTTP